MELVFHRPIFFRYNKENLLRLASWSEYYKRYKYESLLLNHAKKAG